MRQRKYLGFSGLFAAAIAALLVANFATPASSQGLATCFQQPSTGIGLQACPTTGFAPYIPEVTVLPPYADAAIGAATNNGNVATYSASLVEGVPAAAGTDVFCIAGSSTKIVRILRWDVSGTQTTAGITPISINVNSAADTGGTPGTTPTIIKHDTADVAATATLVYYTANPTIGSALGAIRTAKVLLPAPAGTSFANGPLFNFVDFIKPIVLRGAAQQACINWNAKTTSGNLLDSNLTWTETTN